MSKKYKAEREVLTYSYIYRTAVDALERASGPAGGGFYQLMSSLVFSAFTLEAYLNHLGERVIPYWPEVDKIQTLKKLKVLHSHLDMFYDPSSRPIQTVIQLFRFRNFMAHGRTESVSATLTELPADYSTKNLVETEWEEFCNEKEAKRALDDVQELAERLHKAAGLGEHPFAYLGSGGTSLEP